MKNYKALSRECVLNPIELWELVALKTQKKRLGKSLEYAISSHITLLNNKRRLEIEWRGRINTIDDGALLDCLAKDLTFTLNHNYAKIKQGALLLHLFPCFSWSYKFFNSFLEHSSLTLFVLHLLCYYQSLLIFFKYDHQNHFFPSWSSVKAYYSSFEHSSWALFFVLCLFQIFQSVFKHQH